MCSEMQRYYFFFLASGKKNDTSGNVRNMDACLVTEGRDPHPHPVFRSVGKDVQLVTTNATSRFGLCVCAFWWDRSVVCVRLQGLFVVQFVEQLAIDLSR